MNCPSTVEVLKFDTLANSGTLQTEMTTFVGSDLGSGGGLNMYEFADNFETELPKCSKITGFKLVAVTGRVTDLDYLEYSTGDCNGSPCN